MKRWHAVKTQIIIRQEKSATLQKVELFTKKNHDNKSGTSSGILVYKKHARQNGRRGCP